MQNTRIFLAITIPDLHLNPSINLFWSMAHSNALTWTSKVVFPPRNVQEVFFQQLEREA